MHHLATRPKLRRIPSILSWVSCFAVYVAVLSESQPHLVQSRLAYMCLIIREARRAGGDGWVSYDAVYRQNAAQDNTTDWSKLDASLHSSTFLSTRRTNTTFCSLCFESDHTSSSCALAPLMSEGGRSSPPIPTRTYHTNKGFHIPDQAFCPSQPYPRSSAQFPICQSWNKGKCVKAPHCRFRHICATCSEDHKAANCVLTPHIS